MTCRHCPNKGNPRERGLCRVCYRTPAILALYPPRRPPGAPPEETAEELDELERRMRPTMPATSRDRREVAALDGRRVPSVVSRGLAIGGPRWNGKRM